MLKCYLITNVSEINLLSAILDDPIPLPFSYDVHLTKVHPIFLSSVDFSDHVHSTSKSCLTLALHWHPTMHMPLPLLPGHQENLNRKLIHCFSNTFLKSVLHCR